MEWSPKKTKPKTKKQRKLVCNLLITLFINQIIVLIIITIYPSFWKLFSNLLLPIYHWGLAGWTQEEEQDPTDKHAECLAQEGLIYAPPREWMAIPIWLSDTGIRDDRCDVRVHVHIKYFLILFPALLCVLWQWYPSTNARRRKAKVEEEEDEQPRTTSDNRRKFIFHFLWRFCPIKVEDSSSN